MNGRDVAVRLFRQLTARAGRRPTRDAQLNVYNVAAMLAGPPDRFATLRVDANNDCNVHCVYCHNDRSREVLSRTDLSRFLNEHVIELNEFQMGCIMEPTLDSRLCDLLLDVAASPARPAHRFLLQTNGILLHLHDPSKIRDARLTHVSVSIDSADPSTHKALRGGTSLSKVARNIEQLRQACPSLQWNFITTVTRLNVTQMAALVQFGLDLGVSHFVMREVFYHPESTVVDHARMPPLMLARGEFGTMADELRSTFQGRATFEFADDETLERFDRKILRDSLR